MTDRLNTAPGSAEEWYELGGSFRKLEQFGDAINAFRMASALAEKEEGNEVSPDRASALGELRLKAEASIELILSIRGFVNKDLMNP